VKEEEEESACEKKEVERKTGLTENSAADIPRQHWRPSRS